jgi:hypothetical protein
MNPAPNHPSPEGRPATPAANGLSPAMSAWDTYYKEASRRRRAGGGDRHLRAEKRRRRFRERIGIGISTLVVGMMTLIFYLMLR